MTPATPLTLDAVALCCELVGKPFAWHGRGPVEYDCWGLLRECMLRAGVRDIPDYRSCTEGVINATTMLNAMANGWRKLDGPRFGAAVVFRIPCGGHMHVGFMLGRSQFLHTSEQTHGAVVESLRPLWERLVLGYYIWEPETV